MIMLPVAAVAFFVTGDDNFTLTPEETADRAMGTAQAVISWPYDGPVQQLPEWIDAFTGRDTPRRQDTGKTDDQVRALLPAGSRVIPFDQGTLSMHTATGIGTNNARMLDY